MSPLGAVVARTHPELPEESVDAVVKTVAEEIYWEMIARSIAWGSSDDVGAKWFEAEARSCASLVYAYGKAN